MGIFCLVLHTHLPYVRRNGVWPCGEDFFHQAATECYLPLLGVFERLADRGVRDAFTLGLSPMVAHQMQDEHMLSELGWYLGAYEIRALKQVANYEGPNEPEFKELAGFYGRFAREHGERLDRVRGRGIASAFDALARAGLMEIIGGPATHPYLPLVREPTLAGAQLRLGAREHERLLGRAPAGMWLPECAYAPDAGIEASLSAAGFHHVVVDGPTMLRSAGPGSTFRPRRLADSAVSVFARNLDVTYRVWSPTGGYPAGRWYRDFFHYDLVAGFKNWRVTSIRKDVSQKRPYEPQAAVAAARADAEDFARLIARTLEEHERVTGEEGVVVAAYDTELFGHWWFEGPAFLERLFEVLAATPAVRPRSLAGALRRFDPPEPVALQAGSWGFRKDDRSWVDDATRWMWDALGEVEADTVRIAEKHAGAAGARGDAVAQLVREALLMQSSDWPFMVLRGRNPEYAAERFSTHHQRWRALAQLLGSRAPEQAVARETTRLFEIDNVLPAMDATALR